MTYSGWAEICPSMSHTHTHTSMPCALIAMIIGECVFTVRVSVPVFVVVLKRIITHDCTLACFGLAYQFRIRPQCARSQFMDARALLELANSNRLDVPDVARRNHALGWARRFAVSRRRDRLGGESSGLRRLADVAHVQFANRTKAVRFDDVMEYSGFRRPKRSGQGKWKQLTPQEILKNSFSPPAQTMVSIAKACKSSSRHVTDCAFTCGKLLIDKQRTAISSLLDGLADWSHGFSFYR